MAASGTENDAKRPLTPKEKLIWTGVAILGAVALGGVAIHRGETINSAWLVVAAVCVYALGYRFYSAFIAAKVLALDINRATPAERLDNGLKRLGLADGGRIEEDIVQPGKGADALGGVAAGKTAGGVGENDFRAGVPQTVGAEVPLVSLVGQRAAEHQVQHDA